MEADPYTEDLVMQAQLQEVEERLEARESVVAGLHQQLGAKQVQVKKLRNFLKADLHSRVIPSLAFLVTPFQQRILCHEASHALSLES